MWHDDNSNVNCNQGNVMELTYAQTNDQTQDNLRYYNGLHDDAQKQFDANLAWDDLLSVINNDMAETQSSTITWMASTCHDKVKSERISEIVKYLSTNNSVIRTGISTSTQMKSDDIVQGAFRGNLPRDNNGLTNHNVDSARSASSAVGLENVYNVAMDISATTKPSALTKVPKSVRGHKRKFKALKMDTPATVMDSGIKTDSSPMLAQIDSNTVSKTLLELKKNAGSVYSMQMGSQRHDQFQYTDISIIAKAIMSTPQKRMHANDICRYILENFRSSITEKGWEKNILFILSTNECFLHLGPDKSGIGNYWAIHPNFEAYFRNGDFRLRQARMRASQNMKTVPNRSLSSMLLQESAAGYRTMTPPPVCNHPYLSIGLQQPTSSAGIHPAPSFSALRTDNEFSFPFAQYTPMPHYGCMHNRSNSGNNCTPTHNSAQNDMMANWAMPQQGNWSLYNNHQGSCMHQNNNRFFKQ